jgi:hypothetical protein
VKRFLLIALAFVLVAILASVKLRKRSVATDADPSGTWEPADGPTAA